MSIGEDELLEDDSGRDILAKEIFPKRCQNQLERHYSLTLSGGI